jgi:hypothetical protein
VFNLDHALNIRQFVPSYFQHHPYSETKPETLQRDITIQERRNCRHNPTKDARSKTVSWESSTMTTKSKCTSAAEHSEQCSILPASLLSHDNTFKHVALDETQDLIRIVHVLPDLSALGHIQCEISSTAVSGGTYRCLSYMWGPPPAKHWIEVNGKLFAIRTNLWHFLDLARSAYANTSLWIDGLCIDQDNVLEKNHQVGTFFSDCPIINPQ